MVIVCEGCGARFRMNHALFQDAKGARIRCRKCGGHIEVRHPEASPVHPAPEVPSALRYEPAPTAFPEISEVVSKEGPVTAPVFPTENPLSHAPSSDALVPPAKPEAEKEAPMPEKAVFSPSVPVADTNPFSSGDNSYDAGPHLAGVPVGYPGGETSDILQVSPTFQVDMSSAAWPGLDSSPPDEQAILPVFARIEGESEIVPVVEAEPEPIAEAHVPTELEPSAESQAYVLTFEPGDTVPEEESKLAQHAPWMETVPAMDAPDAAPAINCNRDGVNMKTYAVYRIGYWNNKLELIGKVVERRKEERKNNAADMLRWAQKIYAASSVDSNIFIVKEGSSEGAIFGGA
jgi:DNA-directed RNA polymerase subunit RPC12/RpoP